MIEKQKTIQHETAVSGVGLHTGAKTTVRLKPAGAGSGISFVRVDLPGSPVIRACPENVISQPQVPRCTVIGKDNVSIQTVEHLMSVLWGLGIDNLVVEIDGDELPGLDGSGRDYLALIKKAGVKEQDAPRKYIEIKEPIAVDHNGSALLIVPSTDFKVAYSLNYNHGYLKSQYFAAVLDGETFEKEIASCRTFCLEEEAKELQANGLGKGANFDNTLVVGKKGVIRNKLRFENEFARHKVLDLIGDLYLLGLPLRGHVFAVKSGHQLNIALIKKIFQQMKRYEQKGFIPASPPEGKTQLNIQEIMKVLPHRYPFLLVDRIIELEKGKRAVGIKNVTINDGFFRGHFPTRPIMPGVLMVEAMAQTGGVLVLTNEDHQGKLALFMGADNVKFRKLVEPGDQLRFEVELVRGRSRTASLRGVTKVNEEVVAEADLLFSFTDAEFLG